MPGKRGNATLTTGLHGPPHAVRDRRLTRRQALRAAAGAAAGLYAGSAVAALGAAQHGSRPNIALILTDDMRVDDLAFMPNVQSLLVDQGVTFANFAATSPGCAPARASILRGQYPHNHGILRGSGDLGGADVFRDSGYESSTIATWLQDAGYRTALIGKYLNGYGATVEPTYIPPGWDEWDVATREGYSRFELNENGTLTRYKSGDEEQYSTDVLARKAETFVTAAAQADEPFFLYLAPRAPHGPAEPASRHASAFADVDLPRTDALGEEDVTDKPHWVQLLPKLDDSALAELDGYYRARLQTLLAVDEMVAGLVASLERAGALDDTFIVFTSDNGYSLGEHRIVQEKGSPYEQDIMVPLVIRGPGIPAGVTIDALASQADLAPTFAAWAGADAPGFVDGRSLAAIASGEPASASWRTTILIEQFANNPARTEKQPAFEALRTGDLIFVAYGSGERELYDLAADPLELQNLATRANPALVTELLGRAEAMKMCAGETCRAIESAPLTATLATPAAPG
jgi:arylsulfatase A-like enzyme